MSKNIKLLLSASVAVAALVCTTAACNRDEINSLDERVTKIENTLSSLQSQISSGAVISSVTSVSNGVTVTLSDGSSFTLTNGSNGQDGQAGSVVTIGENGNWFIDGVDTGLAAQGKDGQNGQNGQNGEQGEKGEDGADAPTVYYYPGEDGYFVKVTIDPDGKKTEETTTISYLVAGCVTAVLDTENGVLTLYNVEGAEGGVVSISLNATLKSLAFVPAVVADGYGVIDFVSITYKDKKGDDNFIVSNNPVALYRANPANVDVDGIEWSFIRRNVTVTTRVAGDDEDSIIGELISVKDGGLTFELSATKTLSTKTSHFVALKGAFDAEEIVSDYALATQSSVDSTDLSIINAEYWAAKQTKINYSDEKVPATSATADLELIYGQELDINDYLATYVPACNQTMEDLNFTGLKYDIALTDEYLDGSGTKVDQNKCVNLVDGVMTAKEGTSNVGKTPVVKVEAYVTVDGKKVVLATSFIKVEIVAEKKAPVDLITLDFGTVEYSELTASYKDNSQTFTATEFNAKVLDVLGLTPAQYASGYYTGLYISDEGDDWVAGGLGLNFTLSTIDFTAGNTYTFGLTNRLLYNDGAKDVILYLKSRNAQVNPDIHIHIKYNIVHDLDACWPAFDDSYVVNGEAKVKGKMDNNNWVVSAALAEHFAKLDAEEENITVDLPKLDKNGNVDEKNGTAQAGAVELIGNTLKDAVISYKSELSKDMTYVVRLTRTHANGMTHQTTYKVTFCVPFTTSVAAISLTDSQQPQTADVSKSMTIADLISNYVVFEKGAAKYYDLDKDGKPETLNKYNLETSDFQITTKIAEDKYQTGSTAGLTCNGKEITWQNEGTLLQANKVIRVNVTVKIDGIYLDEIPVDITIKPAN